MLLIKKKKYLDGDGLAIIISKKLKTISLLDKISYIYIYNILVNEKISIVKNEINSLTNLIIMETSIFINYYHTILLPLELSILKTLIVNTNNHVL